MGADSFFMYQLRPYQQAASDAAVGFFNSRTLGHGLIVLGTGTGKSLVIADIANRMDSDILILQPSKEILEQNFNKLVSYGYLFCSIYSASCGSKDIGKVTFATIGSIYKKPEAFAHFKYCIIDECDTVDPHGGMYFDFLKKVGCKTIGLTATPYRLAVNSFGASLRFITRTRPRFFSEVLYYTQVADTMKQGYLSKMEYYSLLSIDIKRLRVNSTGQNYTDQSVRDEYKRSGFTGKLANVIERLLYNAKVPRKGILVFTRFIEESEEMVKMFPTVSAIVTGQTPKAERERILQDFKSGKIRVVFNVNTLSCLSSDTEILTRNKGWIGINDIDENCDVAQYENEQITFHKPLRIIKKIHSGKFVSLQGRYMNIRVTNDHDMLYRKKTRSGLGTFTKKAAEHIAGERVYIPVSGFSDEEKMVAPPMGKRCSDKRFLAQNSYNYRKKGMSYEQAKSQAEKMLKIRNSMRFLSPKELTEDHCRFIGFWIGDGSVSNAIAGGKSYSMCQSLKYDRIIEWIEGVMNRIGVSFTISDRKRDCKCNVLGKECHVSSFRIYSLPKGTGGIGQHVETTLNEITPYLKKDGTELFWGLSRPQFFALMEGLFQANGTPHGNLNTYKGQGIVCPSKKLADLLQAIGVCRGYKINITEVGRKDHKTLYKLSLSDKRYHELANDRLRIEEEQSNETVWCVTMPKGNIVTRRNGRVTIMGNCGFDYPELDTVVLARPTRSLRLYYQQVGRAIRPHKEKQSAWVIDLCGTYNRFGKVEDLHMRDIDGKGKWIIESNGKQLTNIILE